MSLLFQGKPWDFLLSCDDDEFEFQKASAGSTQFVKTNKSNNRNALPGQTPTSAAGRRAQMLEPDGVGVDVDEPVPNRILSIFKQAAWRAFRKHSEFAKACYLELILAILVAQDKEFKKNVKV